MMRTASRFGTDWGGYRPGFAVGGADTTEGSGRGDPDALATSGLGTGRDSPLGRVSLA